MRLPVFAAAGLTALAINLSPAAADIIAEFHCADGTAFSAAFTPPGEPSGRVTLTYPDGRTVVLPQAPSADGGRYAEGASEFWVKGAGGRLTLDGKETTCEAKP